jgi:predicted transcriptional regulator
MSKRITLTLSDETAERFQILADYYELPPATLAARIIEASTHANHAFLTYRDEIREAVNAMQEQWLADVAPSGNA